MPTEFYSLANDGLTATTCLEFYSLVNEELTATACSYMGAVGAHATRHLGFMCSPVPRGSMASCNPMCLRSRWGLVRELAYADGGGTLSLEADDIESGVIRYCPGTGQFFRCEEWAHARLPGATPFAINDSVASKPFSLVWDGGTSKPTALPDDGNALASEKAHSPHMCADPVHSVPGPTAGSADEPTGTGGSATTIDCLMNTKAVSYRLVVAGRAEAKQTAHLSSMSARNTRHLAYFCHPRPRGWKEATYEVDMNERDDVLEELDSYDGSARVSATAAEVLAGVIRYCIVSGKFYRASGWAVRNPADLVKPESCASALVSTNCQMWHNVSATFGASNQDGQLPISGAKVSQTSADTACAKGCPLDTEAQAPSAPDACGGRPTAEKTRDRESLQAVQDCGLGPSADVFAATWACLAEYEPVYGGAKSLRGSQNTESPTWLHDLPEWWSLRRLPDAWSKAREAELDWLSAVVPLGAGGQPASSGHGPAEIATRLDLARKKAYRGALKGRQDWPADLLDGLRVLERFTPGITSQSRLTELAHEAYGFCRQALATAIEYVSCDAGRARNSAGGLPLSVRQKFMADWVLLQRRDVCVKDLDDNVASRTGTPSPDGHMRLDAETPLADPRPLEGRPSSPGGTTPPQPAGNASAPTDRRRDFNVHESPSEILARIARTSKGLHGTSPETFESQPTSALEAEVFGEDASGESLPVSETLPKPTRDARGKAGVRPVSKALVNELLKPSAVAGCDVEFIRSKAKALTAVGDSFVHTSLEACREDLHTIAVGDHGPLPPGLVARCAHLMNAHVEQLLESESHANMESAVGTAHRLQR